MAKNERYREVAVYYMEQSNAGTGVASEFKSPLASVYGLKTFDAPERAEMQEKFWANVLETARD